MRAPGLGDHLHRGRVREPVEPVGAFDRAADPEVAHRQHVGTLEVEHQEHLRGPQPEALDGGQLGDHLLVLERVEALELELAREHVLGERAQVADLRA